MMKKVMRLLLVFILIVSSCSDIRKRPEHVLMEKADSLMIAHPDSALSILQGMEVPREKASRMRYEMLLTDAINKNNLPLTSDSTMKEVVAYYDRHGTANDRLRANYLLGYIYQMLGDGPLALEYYLKAESCADTTQTDCDYHVLVCIHNQAYNLYKSQLLSQQMIHEADMMGKCAQKDGDSLAMLYPYNLRSRAYYMQRDTTRVLSELKAGYEMAVRFGNKMMQTSFIGGMVPIYNEYGDYKKSKELIDIFEKSSAWNPSYQNFSKSMGVFYYNKGMYYLGTGHPDSAAYLFYKEKHTTTDFNNQQLATIGLLRVYEHLNKPDSVAKYAMLAYSQNNKAYSLDNKKSLQLIQSTYDYSVKQKEAQIEREKRQLIQRKIQTTILLAFIVLAAAAWAITYRFRHLRKDKERVEQERADAMESYLKLSAELHQIRQDLPAFIAEKEEDLEEQATIVMKHSEGNADEMMEEMTKGNLLLEKLHKSVQPASKQELDILLSMVRQQQPDFYHFISDMKKGLTRMEFLVCILIRLRFNPAECGNLLDVSPQRTTNLRSQINSKLFKKDSAKNLDYNIRMWHNKDKR